MSQLPLHILDEIYADWIGDYSDEADLILNIRLTTGCDYFKAVRALAEANHVLKQINGQ